MNHTTRIQRKVRTQSSAHTNGITCVLIISSSNPRGFSNIRMVARPDRRLRLAALSKPPCGGQRRVPRRLLKATPRLILALIRKPSSRGCHTPSKWPDSDTGISLATPCCCTLVRSIVIDAVLQSACSREGTHLRNRVGSKCHFGVVNRGLHHRTCRLAQHRVGLSRSVTIHCVSPRQSLPRGGARSLCASPSQCDISTLRRTVARSVMSGTPQTSPHSGSQRLSRGPRRLCHALVSSRARMVVSASLRSRTQLVMQRGRRRLRSPTPFIAH